jgi:hypothetical protein
MFIQPSGGGNLIKRFIAGLTVFLTAAMLLASSAWSSPYLQNQPRHSGYCGEFATSNAINWVTGASTTGWQIYRQFPHYRDPGGASYHTGKRDLIKAAGRAYGLSVQKFVGSNLHEGIEAAKQSIADGGAVIMLADNGKLTSNGHFVMGYQYGHGGKIAVSDSNRKNPDKWYAFSWLLNAAKGHVYKIWTYNWQY